MKGSGIITVAGGVGAMLLLGLMVVLRGDAPEPLRTPASGPRGAAASSPATQGAAPGRAMAPSPTLGTLPSGTSAAQRPSPAPAQPALPAGMNPPGGTEGSAQAQAGTAGTAGTVGEVDKVLDVARRAPREDDRINALRWLGENATPQQFDAMQDIQINDPSPEVRRAAEFAVNELRRRRAHDTWPGVPSSSDPQEYMRTVSQPSP